MSRERKLLGYVVKLPDGTRSPRTPKPETLQTALRLHTWPGAHGSHVAPVFAVRKPMPSPVPKPAPCRKRLETPGGALMAICGQGQWTCLDCSQPKPAPAEGAAEGRYAVLVDQKGAPHFVDFGLDLTMHVSDRDAMEYERARVMVGRKASDAPVRLVRVLDDGAHEAACEAAAERGRIEALTSIRDACEFKADTVHDGPAMGLRMAMVLVDNAFKRLGEEKGQAK